MVKILDPKSVGYLFKMRNTGKKMMVKITFRPELPPVML